LICKTKTQNKMKNKGSNFWSAVILILLLTICTVSGYLLGFSKHAPIISNDEVLEQKIQQQNDKIICLLDSIDYQKAVVDSLENIKQKRDTIWKTKIINLQNISISGQYEILSENLLRSCDIIESDNWYVLNGDTFKLFTLPELICINSTFYDRERVAELYYLTNEQLINQKEITYKLEKVITHKDTIINAQDSAITSKNIELESLTKSNKSLKNWLKGIGITASGLLILLIAK